ncbi:MAG: hypothetical protein ABI760_05240 [Ferruginibacter sp.]
MTKAKLSVIVISFLYFCIAISCNNNAKSLTPKQITDVQGTVMRMTKSIAKDISREGSIAWLKYFENTPEFFMASEGRLVFQNNDSATNFIKNILVKNIKKIELSWSNILIDPLTLKFANVAATFHEDITDFSGKTISEDGYFTGIAEKTSQGWKLRNAHWSTKNTK